MISPKQLTAMPAEPMANALTSDHAMKYKEPIGPPFVPTQLLYELQHQ